MSKLRASTLRCAFSIERVTMPASIASPSGIFRPLHDRRDAVAGEDAHQIVVERQVEARRARVALAAGAAAQLVVDAAGLVPLGADDVQPAERDHLASCVLCHSSRSFGDAARFGSLIARLVGLDALDCFSRLPPSTMSVPRPAMLVAIVITPGRPAWATISASRRAAWR